MIGLFPVDWQTLYELTSLMEKRNERSPKPTAATQTLDPDGLGLSYRPKGNRSRAVAS
jgi:hypothetical protein